MAGEPLAAVLRPVKQPVLAVIEPAVREINPSDKPLRLINDHYLFMVRPESRQSAGRMPEHADVR